MPSNNKSVRNRYNPHDHRREILKLLNNTSTRHRHIIVDEISRKIRETPFIDDPNYLTEKILINRITYEELQEFLLVSQDNVLEDREVEWIKNSLRVALWFDKYLESYNVTIAGDYRIELAEIEYIDILEYSVFRFDASRVYDKNISSTDTFINLPRSNNYINGTSLRDREYRRVNSRTSTERSDRRQRRKRQLSMKRKFVLESKKTYSFQRIDDKDLRWLDATNTLKVQWAIEYLYNHDLILEPRTFVALSTTEQYALICASLDSLELDRRKRRMTNEGLQLYKKDVLNKLRNAWSQKKFRDKQDADTAQEYFLTTPYRNKLKKLADKEDMSTVAYLQFLIDLADDER